MTISLLISTDFYGFISPLSPLVSSKKIPVYQIDSVSPHFQTAESLSKVLNCVSC